MEIKNQTGLKNFKPQHIHCRCAQNNISIMHFLHSAEGKVLVLTVQTSQEKRDSS